MNTMSFSVHPGLLSSLASENLNVIIGLSLKPITHTSELAKL